MITGIPNLKAGALPVTLIVSTLMLLSVMGIFLLWDSSSAMTSFDRYRTQQLLNLESAATLYCNDSSTLTRLSPDSTLQLFPESESSKVKIVLSRLGLYEVVETTTTDNKLSRRVIVGQSQPWIHRTSLYVSDNKRPLSVTGRTDIGGRVHLPKNGVNYTQMNSEFFTGTKIPMERIQCSQSELPEISPAVTKYVNTLIAESQPLVEWLFISKEMELEDTVIVAKSIEIESGFVGTAQFFATDTIIVGEGAQLKYPSGIYLTGDKAERYAKVYAGASIAGYVVIDKSSAATAKGHVNYLQCEDAEIRGIVWCGGAAECHGKVTGALYVSNCVVLAPEGIYSNTIHNLSISDSGQEMAFPVLLRDSWFERRKIKRLSKPRQQLTIRGSSLIEVIVSSIIALVVFALTMDILVRVSTSKSDGVEIVAADMAVKKALRDYSRLRYEAANYEKSYDWGDLNIIVTDIHGRLQRLEVQAVMRKNGTKITHTKIIAP